MKTLKTSAALVLLLLAGTGTHAQNSDNGRYIEVTVTDSVNMMPDLIEYTVSLRAKQLYNYEYEDYEPASTDNVDQQLDAKQREEKLKLEMQVNNKKFIQLLEKEKITYTFAEPKPMVYNMYMPGAKNTKEKNFVIKFKSLEQVEAFTGKIPEDLYYDGVITSMICTKQQVLEDKLLEKLMLKAKKQAEKVAGVSSVKLGPLQQFSDNTDNNLVKGLSELYMSFMSMYEREKFLSNSTTMQLRKTARVRFSVE